jgi:hypothetical protein
MLSHSIFFFCTFISIFWLKIYIIILLLGLYILHLYTYHGCDHMVQLCNQCLSPLKFEPRSWQGVIYTCTLTTLCDNACQWLATGWWFSPVSYINKIDHHHITEILLKVANAVGPSWSDIHRPRINIQTESPPHKLWPLIIEGGKTRCDGILTCISGLGLGLWCLTSPSTIFQLYRRLEVSFIGGGNRSTLRKPLTCRKSVTNFIT